MVNKSPIAPGTTDIAVRIAEEHDARTLAAALVARLHTDGRAELADAVVAALSGDAGGIILGGPGNPHHPTEGEG